MFLYETRTMQEFKKQLAINGKEIGENIAEFKEDELGMIHLINDPTDEINTKGIMYSGILTWEILSDIVKTANSTKEIKFLYLIQPNYKAIKEIIADKVSINSNSFIDTIDLKNLSDIIVPHNKNFIYVTYNLANKIPALKLSSMKASNDSKESIPYIIGHTIADIPFLLYRFDINMEEDEINLLSNTIRVQCKNDSVVDYMLFNHGDFILSDYIQYIYNISMYNTSETFIVELINSEKYIDKILSCVDYDEDYKKFVEIMKWQNIYFNRNILKKLLKKIDGLAFRDAITVDTKTKVLRFNGEINNNIEKIMLQCEWVK